MSIVGFPNVLHCGRRTKLDIDLETKLAKLLKACLGHD